MKDDGRKSGGRICGDGKGNWNEGRGENGEVKGC